MKKWIALIGMVLIAGCSTSDLIDNTQQPTISPTTNITTPSPDAYATNWANLISALTAQSDMLTALPTTTPIPVTPLEPILLTLEAQNVEMQRTLEALGNENQSLQADVDRLNVQLQAAQSQTVQNPTSSVIDGQAWPEGVTDVVFVERSHVWGVVGKNNLDRPIMEVYQPRIDFMAGQILQVYTKRIKVDGGGIFYEIFDPDGVVSVVLYLRDTDIRFIDSTSLHPYNVIDITAKNETNLYYVVSLNKNNIPLIQTLVPRITFGIGAYIDVYVEPVLADGGSKYLKVYDPNRKYGLEVYLLLEDISFIK